MSERHTPGPWRFEDEMVRAADDAVIADPYCEETANTRPGEMEANARLIAASPALLAACKEIVQWHNLIRQNYPDMAGLIRGMEQALAAIAAAEPAEAGER